jgi:tetratricopeptide (TPR) repeat protein
MFSSFLTCNPVRDTQPGIVGSNVSESVFSKWLAPSTAEVEAQLGANRQQRVDGTLRWVLNLPEFKSWRLNEFKKRATPAETLWITGLPGMGKSTISAYIHDLLASQYPEMVVSYFFCKSGTTHLNHAHHIVRTISYQVAMKQPLVKRYLESKMIDLPTTGGNENLAFLFHKLINEPLQECLPDAKLFILLDGIDELEDSAMHQSVSKLRTEIETLLELVLTLPQARVLVTSRSSPELRRILEKSGSTRTLSRNDNTDDIERYVDSRVSKSTKLAQGFKNINKAAAQFFAEKANGIFLWVVIVLDILDRTTSSKSFASALEDLPPAMNNLYEQILLRSKKSGNYEWIKLVLGLTLVARQPLTLDQMKQALELLTNDEVFDMEDLLRSECGSLVDLVPVFGTRQGQSFEIHIAHETFQTYLTTSGNSGDQNDDAVFSARQAHGKAALACLRYLKVGASWENPIHSYAIQNLTWHLEESCSNGNALPSALATDISQALQEVLASDMIDPWLDFWLHPGPLPGGFAYVCGLNDLICKWYRENEPQLANTVETSSNTSHTPADSTSPISGKELDFDTLLETLWVRSCHVWLWNTWSSWQEVNYCYRSLVKLNILVHNPQVHAGGEQTVETFKSQGSEPKEVSSQEWILGDILGEMKSNPLLNAIFRREQTSRKHFDDIARAGGSDEMSGVCQSNLAIACSFLGLGGDNSWSAFDEGVSRIQDAIDEDPEGHPRYFETLGWLHEALAQEDLAIDAYTQGIRIDPGDISECRMKYYLLKQKKAMRAHNPNYDAIITLLDEAIKEDPRNASGHYFNLRAETYQLKGDISGARQALLDFVHFDPTQEHLWEEIAETYIDKKTYRERREFDWRGYCDTLAEATVQDPSRAAKLWEIWIVRAETLRSYQRFKIAIDMLEYGIERCSQMKTGSAAKARSTFEEVLGKTYCSMMKWDVAVPLLEDALKHRQRTSGNLTLIYRMLGHAYTGTGRYDEALVALTNAIADDDTKIENTWTRAEVAEIHLLNAQFPKALREYKTTIRVLESWITRSQQVRKSDETSILILGKAWKNLGCVYDRMVRPEQAKSCFSKAIPYFHQECECLESGRETQMIRFLHRYEARYHAQLAWLYERVESTFESAERHYEKAVEVFEKTVFEEDDFLEETEYEEARRDLERVKRGEKWVFPGEEEDRKWRERARVTKYRSDWGVNISFPNRSVATLVRGN